MFPSPYVSHITVHFYNFNYTYNKRNKSFHHQLQKPISKTQIEIEMKRQLISTCAKPIIEVRNLG